MSSLGRPDLQRDDLPPVVPSLMVSATGIPGDAPPIPWHKYVFYVLGFPVRRPRVWDDDPAPDPREPRRPT